MIHIFQKSSKIGLEIRKFILQEGNYKFLVWQFIFLEYIVFKWPMKQQSLEVCSSNNDMIMKILYVLIFF